MNSYWRSRQRKTTFSFLEFWLFLSFFFFFGTCWSSVWHPDTHTHTRTHTSTCRSLRCAHRPPIMLLSSFLLFFSHFLAPLFLCYLPQVSAQKPGSSRVSDFTCVPAVVHTLLLDTRWYLDLSREIPFARGNRGRDINKFGLYTS